jgi:tetratricopeptide (TPR) repeat protein
VLAWLFEQGDVERVVEVGWGLWLFWFIRDHLNDGRRWIERALFDGERLPPSVRAKALCIAGTLSYPQMRYVEAAEMLDESIRLASVPDDGETLAAALAARGYVALMQLQGPDADAFFARSGRVGRERDDGWAAGRALTGAAVVAFERHDLASAIDLLDEAESMLRGVDSPWHLSLILNHRGTATLQQGDHARADALLRECTGPAPGARHVDVDAVPHQPGGGGAAAGR